MECCGSRRSTPFCPMCGKALRGDTPLEGLLHHIRNRVKYHEQSLEVVRSHHGENSSAYRRMLAMDGRWKGWLEALESVIPNKVAPSREGGDT